MRLLQNSAIVLWFFLFYAFFLLDVVLVAQNENDTQHQLSEILKSTSQIYGPNEMLENGKLYIPAHPKAKGNPYLLDKQWMMGNLIVKGDPFKDVSIKYDVCQEQLILKKESDSQESHIPIVLNNNFIDSFEIEERQFVNLNTMPFIVDFSGFVELIYDSRIIFVIKHSKEFLKQFTQSNPYGAYSKLGSTYYIHKNGVLARLSTKKSFLNYFEPYEKEIKRFMRQNSIRYHKATGKQLFELVKYCDEISIVE